MLSGGVSAEILRVDGLGKAFGPGRFSRRKPVRVLESINVSLKAGDTLAILGPNGSGKTTLLKILAALVEPDSGRVSIAGRDLGSPEARGLVGFASGDERSLFFRLTGRQNLRFFGALFGLSRSDLDRRIRELTATLDLDPFLDRRVDLCSSGMRARLGLARALLHSPELLLLDEPTKSLDPAHASHVRRLVRDLAERGCAAVVATHLVSEAEEIATQIGVFDRSRLHLHAPGSDWQSLVTTAA